MQNKRIAVVGAGITGLTAAWTLQNSGCEVTVFERKHEPGGSIKSVRQGEWLTEYGPNTLQLNRHRVLEFLEDLQLEEAFVTSNQEASKRYLVHNGRLVAAPAGVWDFLSSDLFSGRAKLRVLAEPFVGKGRDVRETLDSFVERRLGREVLNYAVNPFVAGIYAGSPEKLNVRYAFPRLYNLEQNYGSLLVGAVRKKWSERSENSLKSELISYRDGLQTLPEKLANEIDNVFYGEDVSRVQKGKGGWEIFSNGVRHQPFDLVLLNIPLYRINEQLINGGGDLFNTVKYAGYPPISVIHTGYKRNEVDHPLDGFGFLVPEVENRQILGSLFSSSLFPGRAPDQHALITTFIGGERQPQLGSLESEQLKSLVAEEHRNLLGVRGEPVFFDHVYWPKSIPQYGVEYGKILEAISSLEELNPGVYLAGNYRGGISLPDCIESGLDWGEMLGSG